MKWQGINRKRTPVGSGVHFAQNVSLDVDGEMRRRRGFARANFAKQTTGIYGLGVHSTPGTIVAGVGSTLEGLIDGAALWGDRKSGEATCVYGVDGLLYTFTVTPSSMWTRRVRIWARLATEPIANESNVLTIPILIAGSETSGVWTAPTALDYVFRCVEETEGGIIGLGGPVDEIAEPCDCSGVQPSCVVSGFPDECTCNIVNGTFTFGQFNLIGQPPFSQFTSCTWGWTKDGLWSVGLSHSGQFGWGVSVNGSQGPYTYDLQCINGRITGTATVNVWYGSGAFCCPFVPQQAPRTITIAFG